MKSIRKSLVALLTSFSCAYSTAAIIPMDMAVLPTAQGWVYYTNGGVAETDIFSLGAGVLTQQSIGAPFRDYYYFAGALVDMSLPFEVHARARVLADEDLSQFLGGFGLYAFTGTHGFGVSLRPAVTMDYSGTVLTSGIDNSHFHDYVLAVNPSDATFSLTVDGNLIGGGSGFARTDVVGFRIGDSVERTNALAELTSYVIVQGSSVPEPSVPLLLAGAAIAYAARGVRRTNHT